MVEKCTLPHDEYTNESQGFCYVQMATAKAASERPRGQIIEGQTPSTEEDTLTGNRGHPSRLEVTTDSPSDMEIAQQNEPPDPLYCYCNGASSGEMVVCAAEDCGKEWFHLNCVGLQVVPKGKFYFLTRL